MVVDLERLERTAFILKTIAHPLRIGIVELLAHHQRLSVNQICDTLGAEQSLTSHHLSNMKHKGILGSTREGKNIYYFLKTPEVMLIINCMEECGLTHYE